MLADHGAQLWVSFIMGGVAVLTAAAMGALIYSVVMNARHYHGKGDGDAGR